MTGRRRHGGDIKGFSQHKYTPTPDRENLQKNKRNTRIQTLKIHQKFNFTSILKIQKKVARRQLGLIPYRTAKNLDHPKKNSPKFHQKKYILKIHQKFNFASILKIQGIVTRTQLILISYQTAKDLDHPK